SQFWFSEFKQAGLARSHILEVPHPLVWIVQRAKPVLVEAIARRFITGSMWRAYERGERIFCGIALPDGLHRDQRLIETLLTPSTKGVMRGLVGVPEADDANVSKAQLLDHWQAFGFQSKSDVNHYERLLKQGVELIADRLNPLDLMLVDTKFEFGYARDEQGQETLIYMDEVGTPDSSRIWDGVAYRAGRVVENSKEEFRQALLHHVNDPDLLLDHRRFAERQRLAESHALPAGMLRSLSEIYLSLAERIIGAPVEVPEQPLESIMAVLGDGFGIAK
ncbi:phosphoribosylaminoimidazolesuccinocarboxamide synthase, partial [Luminiphilus sp.]|nr:phosphoribosylaminoimidazolesuccinocarboxamide synthase [Luminiphilus sp.]